MTLHRKPVDLGRDPIPQAFSIANFREYLELAGNQYSKSSPALADWIDDVYIRLGENLASVSALELAAFSQLWQYGEWEQPNYAQNRIYKVRVQLGMDAGVCSF